MQSWGQAIIPVSTKMRWATNCAEAVAHLHSRSPPLIHRDLKPQNILLTEGDTPTCKLVSLVWQPALQSCPAFLKLCVLVTACVKADFGTSRAVGGSNALTAKVGTVAYMPPE